MSIRPLAFLALSVTFFLGTTGLSHAAPPSTKLLAKPIPSAPAIAAKSYLLEDIHSGKVIASKDIDLHLEPASLTKMMTSYIVFNEISANNLKLDEKVTISEKAWKMQGSRMFVEVGKKITVEKLLKGMIIQSGNDATVALAEHVAGSEDAFAELMNSYAEQLGMTNTHFVNSTGMPDPEHYTSARDMGILAKAIILNHPEYYKWYSLKEFTYNGIKQSNRNKLLWQDPSVDGIKTGHTQSAGYCLVTSAERKGMRLITVVLGTKSKNLRIQETQKLLNYGFRFFETHLLFEKGKTIKNIKVWKGEKDTVALGTKDDVYVTVPRNQKQFIQHDFNLSDKFIAPISTHRFYGMLNITFNGENIATAELQALEDIPEGSFIKQMIDEFWLLFE